ncbi:MAG: hypothetical protein ACQEQT_05125 [Chloroflexota bacterium]
MHNTLSLAMTGLGALLAAAAALSIERSRPQAPLWLLVLACILGAAGLLPGGNPPLGPCATNLSTLLALAGLGAALWSLSPILLHRHRGTGPAGAAGALLLAATLGGRTLWPSLTSVGPCPASAPFQVAAIVKALTVGLLAWASLSSLHESPKENGSTVESSLAVALALQTTALALRGVGAQWAWGNYWRWDPVECWHLTACLTTAIGLLGIRTLSWRTRAARWTLYMATCLAAAVSFALPPLAAWLGLSSLYMMG